MSIKQPIYHEFDLNATSGNSRVISLTHTDDAHVDTIELCVKQQGVQVDITGATVIARMVLHSTTDVLLNDSVPCTINDAGNILIPFDNAAVQTRKGIVKIEVNITRTPDILTLQLPLWVKINGSILDDATVDPHSEGTIPELLKDAADALEEATQALEQAGDYDNLEHKPQINSHTLSGDKSSDDLGLQKKLTAGTNITIGNDGTISATGGVTSYEELTNKPIIEALGDIVPDTETAILSGTLSLALPFEIDTSRQGRINVDLRNGSIQIEKLNALYLLSGSRGELGWSTKTKNLGELEPNTFALIRSTSQIIGLPINRGGLIVTLGNQNQYNNWYLYQVYITDYDASTNGHLLFIRTGDSQSSPSKNHPASYGLWGKIGGSQNQNGTITFTDSDGNTFTTTGSSVIGTDGFSPTATVTQTASGATVSITDSTGTTTANISNGADGQDYVLTAQDKSDIADIVLGELPTTQGVLYGNANN